MVCNFSIEHGKVPISSKLIRATLQVGMVCQTLTEEPVEEGKEGELTRDNVSCKMMYAANGECTYVWKGCVCVREEGVGGGCVRERKVYVRVCVCVVCEERLCVCGKGVCVRERGVCGGGCM